MRRQESERREIETARREPLEDDGELARRARGLDAAVGRMLREVQDLDAVREERRAGLAEIELAGIELGQVSDETYGRLALASRQVLDLCEEIVVGEPSEIEQECSVHARSIKRAFATPCRARQCTDSHARDRKVYLAGVVKTDAAYGALERVAENTRVPGRAASQNLSRDKRKNCPRGRRAVPDPVRPRRSRHNLLAFPVFFE